MSDAGAKYTHIGKATRPSHLISPDALPTFARGITSTTWELSLSTASQYSSKPYGGSQQELHHINGKRVEKLSMESDFSVLYCLSHQYRNGCLSLDGRDTKEQGAIIPCILPSELSECRHGTSSRSMFRVKSIATSIVSSSFERFLASLEALENPNKMSRGLTRRKGYQEPMDDGDLKPAAKKQAPLLPPLEEYSAGVKSVRLPSLKQKPVSEFQGANSDSRIVENLCDPFVQQCILNVIECERKADEHNKAISAATRTRVQSQVPSVAIPLSRIAVRPSSGNDAGRATRRLSTPKADNLLRRPRIGPGRGSEMKSAAASSLVASDSASTIIQDRVVSVGNGKKILLRGTKHAVKSILRGQSTIVRCPGCQAMLQISSTANNLYCTACQQVSPILDDRSTDNSAMDQEIARAIHRQEIQVSQAAKNYAIA